MPEGSIPYTSVSMGFNFKNMNAQQILKTWFYKATFNLASHAFVFMVQMIIVMFTAFLIMDTHGYLAYAGIGYQMITHAIMTFVSFIYLVLIRTHGANYLLLLYF